MIKKLTEKKDIDRAIAFYEAWKIVNRKQKEMEETKEYFKSMAGTSSLFQIGDITITVDYSVRRKFDRDTLEAEHGKEFIMGYMTEIDIASVRVRKYEDD